MKRWLVLVLAVALVPLALPAPAAAGSSEDAALALGAFAVFNQLVTGQTIFHHGFGPRHVVRETVVVQPPPTVIYAPPPPPTVVYAPPPPPPVVVYPQGHWIAQNGHWVWIPAGYATHNGHAYKGYAYKKHWKRYKKHDDDD